MHLQKDELGTSMIEYVLLASLIFLLCIAGVAAIGTSTRDKLADPAIDAAFNPTGP